MHVTDGLLLSACVQSSDGRVRIRSRGASGKDAQLTEVVVTDDFGQLHGLRQVGPAVRIGWKSTYFAPAEV